MEAASGEEGLAHARRMSPDIIVLDLVMPGLQGTEVLERLAADTATREIPVVVLTATQLDDSDRRALERMVAAIVSKDTLAPGHEGSGLTHTLARLGLA